MPIVAQLQQDLNFFRDLLANRFRVGKNIIINDISYTREQIINICAQLEATLKSGITPASYHSILNGQSYYPSLEELKEVAIPLPLGKYAVHFEKNQMKHAADEMPQLQLFDSKAKEILSILVENKEDKLSSPIRKAFESGIVFYNDLFIKNVRKCFLNTNINTPRFALKSFYNRIAGKDTNLEFRTIMRAAYFNRLLGRTGYAFQDHFNQYLLTDWLPGTSLDKVDEEKIISIPIAKRIKLALMLISEIAILHKSNLVHTGIMPQHIIFGENSLHITHLESAKLESEFTENHPNKLLFLDIPNKKLASKLLDKNNDIYALGLTLVFLFPDILKPQYLKLLTGFLLEDDAYDTIIAHPSTEYLKHKALADFILKLSEDVQKHPSIEEARKELTDILENVYNEKAEKREAKDSTSLVKLNSEILFEIESESLAYRVRQEQFNQKRSEAQEEKSHPNPIFKVPTSSMQSISCRTLNELAENREEVVHFHNLIEAGDLEEIKKIPLDELRIKLFWDANNKATELAVIFGKTNKASELAVKFGKAEVLRYFIDCFPDLLYDVNVGVAALLLCLDKVYSNYALAIELINKGLDPKQIYQYEKDMKKGKTLLSLGLDNTWERYEALFAKEQSKIDKMQPWFWRSKLDKIALIKALESDRIHFIEFLLSKKVDVNYLGRVGLENGNILWRLLEDRIPLFEHSKAVFIRICKLLLDAGANPCMFVDYSRYMTPKFSTPLLESLSNPNDIEVIKLMYNKARDLYPNFTLQNVELFSTRVLESNAFKNDAKARIESAIFILENGGTIDIERDAFEWSALNAINCFVQRLDAPMERIKKLLELLVSRGVNIEIGLEDAEKILDDLVEKSFASPKPESHPARNFMNKTFTVVTGGFFAPQNKSELVINRMFEYIQIVKSTKLKFKNEVYNTLAEFPRDLTTVISQYAGYEREKRHPKRKANTNRTKPSKIRRFN